ncbi:hypothetical protein H4696_000281 [Amycolatopsis lexingtonensis]|uniref:DeoxyPurine in DNA protein A domain-containing protein n=2 Tax=Amycolatopsis lexingtonensis TaxID=218822 RepID=A0ABR9HQH8_9PSEU|nr:hypothetical protein [Amycolatopsis lexingtonensis]
MLMRHAPPTHPSNDLNHTCWSTTVSRRRPLNWHDATGDLRRSSGTPREPVLQGQSIADYHRCADLSGRRGVDFAAAALVGVGSICRRQHRRSRVDPSFAGAA